MPYSNSPIEAWPQPGHSSRPGAHHRAAPRPGPKLCPHPKPCPQQQPCSAGGPASEQRHFPSRKPAVYFQSSSPLHCSSLKGHSPHLPCTGPRDASDKATASRAGTKLSSNGCWGALGHPKANMQDSGQGLSSQPVGTVKPWTTQPGRAWAPRISHGLSAGLMPPRAGLWAPAALCFAPHKAPKAQRQQWDGICKQKPAEVTQARLGLPGMSELGTARAIPMTFQGETIIGEIFSFTEKPKPQSFPKNGYYS